MPRGFAHEGLDPFPALDALEQSPDRRNVLGRRESGRDAPDEVGQRRSLWQARRGWERTGKSGFWGTKPSRFTDGRQSPPNIQLFHAQLDSTFRHFQFSRHLVEIAVVLAQRLLYLLALDRRSAPPSTPCVTALSAAAGSCGAAVGGSHSGRVALGRP
ncbi:MAG: hypothetical protein MJE77_37790 [Proteobacteria bacterium]|nr:hypothetical protein [Pseudomonadota bacterium]